MLIKTPPYPVTKNANGSIQKHAQISYIFTVRKRQAGGYIVKKYPKDKNDQGIYFDNNRGQNNSSKTKSDKELLNEAYAYIRKHDNQANKTTKA